MGATSNLWRGDKVRLRAVEPGDWQTYHNSNDDTEAARHQSIKLHEKLGFQHEGRLVRIIFTDGKFHDESLLGLTVEEFIGEKSK